MPLILLALALVLFVAALCAQDVLRERRAPALDGQAAPANPAHIRVIIPARNEAARIGRCLAGLAAQTHPDFDVVVVDDHSTDGTATVARGFAESLPALAVLPAATLPEGWAGKCWACWQAAERAQSPWLLFLDADVEPQPGLLSAALGRAEALGADVVTLMPLLRMGSLAERLLLPAFQTILYGVYPLHLVSDDASPVAFANGQVLLVRREAYEAVGGHRAVRDSVLEDTDLGQRLKRAGFRLHAASAREAAVVRMYDDGPSTIEGLGKNAVAGFRSGGWRSAWAGLRQGLIAFAPLYLLGAGAALWAGPLLALGGLLLGITAGTTGWLLWRRYRVAPLWALVYPLGLAAYYALACVALARVRGGRGVTWKGRRLAGR